MFTKKELAWIIIAIIILTFIIGFTTKLESKKASLTIIIPLIISILIVLTNTITKKIAAPLFCIKIEHKIWEFKRYGFYERAYLKKPFPIGLVFPFFLTILTLGLIKPLTLLQFDYKNYPQKRILKRYGSRGRRRTEINESDIGFTAALGFYSLFLLAILSVIMNAITKLQIFSELTKYSIYYGLWNLIPIGNLDGSRLFFGSVLNWAIIIILNIIFLILIIVL